MEPLHFVKSAFIDNIRLDIVGLLAILGESPVAQTSRAACLTYAGFFPRLLPAPQALLRTTRLDRLPTVPADVIGFHSGNIRRTLGHIPLLLLKPERLERYQTQCLRIERASKEHEPVVSAAGWGPMTWLAMGGFVLYLALVGLATWLSDGMAILALCLLGFVSFVAHLGLFYRIELVPYEKKRAILPKSDVIIVYPNGTFQIISCDEEIARKLFFETEKCVYKVGNANLYRLLAMLATVTLMVGVICMANASPQLQLSFACVLVTSNAGHWIVAALPEQKHWDLQSFRIEETGKWATARYSQALWTVIASTGNIRWVKAAKIAPDNEAWDDWLDEAQKHLDPSKRPEFRNGVMIDPAWDCQSTLTALLTKYEVLDDKPSFHPPTNSDSNGKQDKEGDENDKLSHSRHISQEK